METHFADVMSSWLIAQSHRAREGGDHSSVTYIVTHLVITDPITIPSPLDITTPYTPKLGTQLEITTRPAFNNVKPKDWYFVLNSVKFRTGLGSVTWQTGQRIS